MSLKYKLSLNQRKYLHIIQGIILELHDFIFSKDALKTIKTGSAVGT